MANRLKWKTWECHTEIPKHLTCGTVNVKQRPINPKAPCAGFGHQSAVSRLQEVEFASGVAACYRHKSAGASCAKTCRCSAAPQWGSSNCWNCPIWENYLLKCDPLTAPTDDWTKQTTTKWQEVRTGILDQQQRLEQSGGAPFSRSIEKKRSDTRSLESKFNLSFPSGCCRWNVLLIRKCSTF